MRTRDGLFIHMVYKALNNHIVNRDDIDEAYKLLSTNTKAFFREKVYTIKKYCENDLKYNTIEEIEYFRKIDDILYWGHGHFKLPPRIKKQRKSKIIDKLYGNS